MSHLTLREVQNMSGNDLGRYLSERDPDLSGLYGPAPIPSSSTTTKITSSGTSSTTNAPSAIATSVINANNQIAQLLAPFGFIIDHLPNPPYYSNFRQDLKVRPVDAFVGLFTPLDWLIYDIVREANAASSVHAGSARRIGLPGHQIDFVMGQSVPDNIDRSVAVYTARLNALNQILILSYQDPRSLVKGLLRALGNAVRAGKLTVQQKVEFLTTLLQNFVQQGFALFHGSSGDAMEDPTLNNARYKDFVNAMIDEIKAQEPALQILVDAKRVFDQGVAAAAAAAQQAQANVAGLARITPIIVDYNALLTLVGPQNAGLVSEVYARGDRGIKDRADAIKVRAQNENHNVPPGIRAILDRITDGCQRVKDNASDMQGYKDNGHNLAAGLVKASRAGSNYQPDTAGIIGLPTTFAGLAGRKGFRGLGVTGIEETLLVTSLVGSGGAGAAANAVATGGTAGVATAPATTPGIGGLIQQILGQFLGGAAGAPGASSNPTITTQPVSIDVAPGGTATFTVVANAPAAPPIPGVPSAALTYQWKKNNVDIPGATSASYTVTNAQPGTLGDDQYSVKVCAGSACVVSSPANLRVRAGAASVAHPQSTLQKALPYVLGAGALVALPVVGPAAAVVLGIGAGAAALTGKKKPTAPASQTPPGVQTVSGRNLGNANLKALLSGIGDLNPADVLAPVASGATAIKYKSGATSAQIKAAKQLLLAAGAPSGLATPMDQWTLADDGYVSQWQSANGVRVTQQFDAATLMAARAKVGSSTGPGTVAKKSVVPLVAGAGVTAAVLYAIFG